MNTLVWLNLTPAHTDARQIRLTIKRKKPYSPTRLNSVKNGFTCKKSRLKPIKNHIPDDMKNNRISAPPPSFRIAINDVFTIGNDRPLEVGSHSIRTTYTVLSVCTLTRRRNTRCEYSEGKVHSTPGVTRKKNLYVLQYPTTITSLHVKINTVTGERIYFKHRGEKMKFPRPHPFFAATCITVCPIMIFDAPSVT